MIFTGLDLETKSQVEGHDEYALQPWRIRTGEVKITHVGMAKRSGQSKAFNFEELSTHLQQEQAGTFYATWNGIFDLACLSAAGFPVERFKWVDGMLLWKWLENGQYKETIPAWSLVDGVRELVFEDWAAAFIKMKEQEDHKDDRYWERRAKMDAFATVFIVEQVWPMLNPQQQKSALIEASCLVPVAKSWVNGVNMHVDLAQSMKPEITKGMEEVEDKLELTCKDPSTGLWRPSPFLRSPQKLCDILYNQWGLPVNDDHRTPPSKKFPEGQPSSGKAALTYLADLDDRATEILAWRKLNTQLTKFIESPLKVRAYLESGDTLHPSPKLFSTYTGRMTYQSKVLRKFPVGMALHQWPRPKNLRKLINPPEGYDLVEFDAAGQEMRIIADLSQDPSMLDVFNRPPPDDDIHSFTGAGIAGISFDNFLKLYREGNQRVAGPTGFRYQGKFTNLSKLYRIGIKTLRIKSRVDYGMDLTFLETKSLSNTFDRSYKEIKKFWSNSIKLGQEQGYVETLGGRRFKLVYWSGDRRWGTEQSAINTRVQGTGGDMKELALAILTKKYPELIFGFDLHDALFDYVPSDLQGKKELLQEARHTLNNLPYEQAWGWVPSIPIPWDGSTGPNWGEMVGI